MAGQETDMKEYIAICLPAVSGGYRADDEAAARRAAATVIVEEQAAQEVNGNGKIIIFPDRDSVDQEGVVTVVFAEAA